MKEKLPFSSYLAIGFMLFALFFGAGNLIFPASLGQNAGENLWPAVFGFLITGTGLPFLGVLAMGFSGSRNLQELASRVHPVYAVFFTALLYLTIGPFFATPRTATVAYDIGFVPYVSEDMQQIGLIIFSFLFFAITLWLSLNPSKIVDRVGKMLAPGIVILLGVLIIVALFNPMGSFQSPQEAYTSGAFMKGFTEGYNTMDAIAALAFGIIVIHAIKGMGVTTKKGILNATLKTGLVAVVLLSVIYVGIAYLGAISVERFGIFETGGPVLSSASDYYFGGLGAVILAIILLLACLTTSIGLVTACAEYFHTLLPNISYKTFAVIFTLISFTIANFGLANIINYSIPVLMFLYPLAIVLVLLAFLSPLFNHSKWVYRAVIAVTFLISIVDGIKTFYDIFEITYPTWLASIVSFYDRYLPAYTEGLGWLLPALIVLVITAVLVRMANQRPAES